MRKPKISFNSPAVLGFAGLCTAAFILNTVTGFMNELLFSVYRAPLTNPFAWLRFIGHVFGHTDWNHFMNNMMWILILGPLLEEKYGTANLSGVMLVTAVVTGLIHFIFSPGIMLLGASGIVFAFILLSSLTSIREGEIPVTFILVAVIYIGREIWSGIFMTDNISNLTHIIGGLVGSACGYLMVRKGGRTYEL